MWIGTPRKYASGMSIPRPGSTVKLKPLPVFTSIPFTPWAFPSVYSYTLAPATCAGSPM